MAKENSFLPQFTDFYTRGFQDSDFDLIYKLRTNADVQAYHPDGIFTLEKAQNYFNDLKTHYEKHKFSYMPIFSANHDFVGVCGLMFFDSQKENFKTGEIEVGYALLPQYWGKGLATHFAQNFVNWGFANLPITKIVSVCNPDNLASANVIKKIGGKFSRSVVNPRFGDSVDLYEITKINT